jgi:hypothetical protein
MPAAPPGLLRVASFTRYRTRSLEVVEACCYEPASVEFKFWTPGRRLGLAVLQCQPFKF